MMGISSEHLPEGGMPIAASEWRAGGSEDNFDFDCSPWCRWCGRYRIVVRCPACNEPRAESFRVLAHDSMFAPVCDEVTWAERIYAYGNVARYSLVRHVAVLQYLHGGPRMRINSWGYSVGEV